MLFRFLFIALALGVFPGVALAKKAVTEPPFHASPPSPETAESDQPVDFNAVTLQGLNKVTGHVSKLTGPLGTVMRFGTLEIIARRCWKSPPEERPESASLLEIRELTPGEGPKQIFMGWMFASSPGLSGLEHPVYDISMLSCEARKDPEQTNAEPPPATLALPKTAAKKK